MRPILLQGHVRCTVYRYEFIYVLTLLLLGTVLDPNKVSLYFELLHACGFAKCNLDTQKTETFFSPQPRIKSSAPGSLQTANALVHTTAIKEPCGLSTLTPPPPSLQVAPQTTRSGYGTSDQGNA